MDRSRRQAGARLRLLASAAAVALTCLTVGYMAGRWSRGGSMTSTQLLHDTDIGAMPSSKEPQGPVCTNTCKLAKNGVCNDGRSDTTSTEAIQRLFKPVIVECDLGTDCDDCGPWQPEGPIKWRGHGTGGGPIATLLAKGVEVRVKAAELKEAPFKFAFTDPLKDHDVSRHMHMVGMVEPAITWIFYHIFKSGCIKPDGSRALFVDVGGNFGWFTVLGAALGCNVIVFEPVPHFRAFLEYSLHLNGLQGRVTVLSKVVSHMPGQQLTMVVPSAGIWGTAGIEGLNIDTSIPGALENITLPSVSLDGVVKQDVLLLKVDVEGWEWSVMQGAQKLLKAYNVENIILEYSPGVAERSLRFDDITATVQMLITLTGQGYRLAHLGEGKEGVRSYQASLPKYEEVTPHNLKYDLRDAALYKKGLMGCFPPAALRWPCNTLPEDVSPRSLRSIMGHNTNIWAARNSQLQQLQGTVGLLELNDPPDKFTITKLHFGIVFGMGMRACVGIEPQYQVRHRCPCSNKTVCGETELLVQSLAKEGKLSTNYVLNP